MKIFPILALLIIPLIPLSTWSKPETLDRIVAVVDDGVILESELNERMETILNRVGENASHMPPLEVLQKQALEHMLLERIQLQMAQRIGIRVDDNEVNEALQNIAQNNQMDVETFRQTLQKQGIDYPQFRKQIRTELITNQVQRKFVGQRIQISDADVSNYLNSPQGRSQLAADYRLGHILIPVPEAPSPEDLKAQEQLAQEIYHKLTEAHADFKQLAISYSAGQQALEGGDLGWKRAAQLPSIFANKVVDMAKGDVSQPIQSPSGFHIIKVIDKRGGTDKMVSQTLVSHILVQPNAIRDDENSRQLIHELYQRAVSGENFNQLAKTYSDDPGSARKGGDLGWVMPGVMTSGFEQTMNATALNEISQPFKTEFGWHILQVHKRRNQDMSEEFRFNQARNFIFKRKFEEELSNWLQEVRQDAFVEIRL